MYLDQDNWKGKVGRINILRRGNSLRLRFTYPAHNRIEITIAKATEVGWQETIQVAILIERDIQLNDFDATLKRYGYKQTKPISVSSKKPNLKETWNSYKEANKNRVAPTTIKHCWNEMDRYIDQVPSSLLKTDKATEFINHLLSIYKPSSLAGIFSASLYPAASQAVKQGILERNVYRDVKLPKTPKKPIECYEPAETKAIISAFYSDQYRPKRSSFSHNYYGPLVEFLAFTGCRPEEAHALTWNDLKRKSDKTYIRFNKAYSNGILLPHTKTHKIRFVPLNKQLQSLLETISVVENQHSLIFPSVTGTFISQGNWRQSYWKRVIDGLVKDDKVHKYLKPYSLRHSFITRLIRKGVDIATVAKLSGNSTDMICRHYLASQEDFEIPEL